MGATQSIRRASVPIVCSTSPVSHQRHKINRASSTNRYQPTTRRTRTLSNTFRRHLSLSVSYKRIFFGFRVSMPPGRKGKSIARDSTSRGKEKFFQFSFLNQRAAGKRQENLSQKLARVCVRCSPVFTEFFFFTSLLCCVSVFLPLPMSHPFVLRCLRSHRVINSELKQKISALAAIKRRDLPSNGLSGADHHRGISSALGGCKTRHKDKFIIGLPSRGREVADQMSHHHLM
jgi:hypothetical protein